MALSEKDNRDLYNRDEKIEKVDPIVTYAHLPQFHNGVKNFASNFGSLPPMWLIGGIIAIAFVWALNHLTGVLCFITGNLVCDRLIFSCIIAVIVFIAASRQESYDNMAEEIMAECAQSRDRDQQ